MTRSKSALQLPWLMQYYKRDLMLQTSLLGCNGEVWRVDRCSRPERSVCASELAVQAQMDES